LYYMRFEDEFRYLTEVPFLAGKKRHASRCVGDTVEGGVNQTISLEGSPVGAVRIPRHLLQPEPSKKVEVPWVVPHSVE
jgi:hypothetical protein